MAALEAAVIEQKETAERPARAKSPPKLETVKPAENAQLNEWLSSQPIRSWAQILPACGQLDLRPYLFVAKDRKDYFGATSILGHLAAVAEKLLGTRFSVQGFENELRQLAGPEAAQVFEAVRGRIIGSDTFDTEPAGAAGIAVLVKAHPSLQRNLIDFLHSLPSSRLGPWACSGWEGVIKDADMVQRFEQLLETWSKEGGQFLKATASTTLRTRKHGMSR